MNWDDELVKATCLTRDGAVVHPPSSRPNATRPSSGNRPWHAHARTWPSRRARRPAPRAPPTAAQADRRSNRRPDRPGAAAAATHGAVDPTVFRLAIFVLAIFVGYYVVWSVTPALHTPLMSVTNAISSVIVVGALARVGVPLGRLGTGSGARARLPRLVLASINIFGGFLVTQRMLAMYKKKG